MSLTLLKPSSGTSGAALGGSNLNFLPSFLVSSSTKGLNDNLPPRAKAITISGLAMKFIVSLLPSFLPGKFLLYDVTIVFGSPFFSSGLLHWPIQGPHAFARTVAPIDFMDSTCPSRSIVALTISEPGVTRRGTFIFAPFDLACSAMLAARDISSYEEFVHDPISATEIASIYELFFTSFAICDIGLARSGV